MQSAGGEFVTPNGQAFTDQHSSVLYTGLAYSWVNRHVVVHELGHQFGLPGGWGEYVDLEVDKPNHLGTGNCVMSYNAGLWVEFSVDALEQIRKSVTP